MTRKPTPLKKRARGAPRHTRTVHGEWGVCESWRQTLPLHPDLGMCGTCTFGEADALLEFDGEWQEGDAE